MNVQCRLSNVAINYLDRFQSILNEMICRMTNVELTNSISNNFIIQMIPHHMAAIEMSRNILNYTTNIPLQEIALNIITSQTKSIENMRQITCCCKKFRNCQQDLCMYQQKVNQISKTMFSKMSNACATNQIDCDFMWEMIPHHTGAVEMSENALQYNICPDLKPILNAIITSQKEGIMKMQNLLNYLGC